MKPQNQQHGDEPSANREELADLILEQIAEDTSKDNRRMKWFVLLAGVLHAGLLMVTVPNFSDVRTDLAARSKPLYVVQQIRFKPPPPQRTEAPRRKKQAKKIPIPDPTPDDPEPFVPDELPVPETDLPEIDGDLLGEIPDAPPAPWWSRGPANGILEVGGDVEAPRRVYAPTPRYTEEARRARIQGVVILETIIDDEGNVERIRILKGLPDGLDQSAMETVHTWKFEPATQDGRPVAVFYHLTVNFRTL